VTAGSYLRHFLILFALSGAVIFMWARTDLFPWIGACSGAGYSDDHYLAYCESGRYGDYEHGALLYEMEAAAIEPIKRAEVLFLGNSRTQYTFSSPPVIEAMNATGRPWYVMGFGFGAKSEMPQAMIERLGLTPRMLVINADPFFNDTNGCRACTSVSAPIGGTRFSHRCSAARARHCSGRAATAPGMSNTIDRTATSP